MPDMSQGHGLVHDGNARSKSAVTRSEEVGRLIQPTSLPRPNHLEKLPPELWTHIASYLHPIDQTCLTLTAKLAKNSLGSRWTQMAPHHRHAFLRRLDPVMPGHRLCFYCAKFHKRLASSESVKLNRHGDPCAVAIAPHCHSVQTLSTTPTYMTLAVVMALTGGPGILHRADVALFAEPDIDYKQQYHVCDCLFDLSEKARRNSQRLVPFEKLNLRIVQMVVRGHRYGPSFGLPVSILCGESNADYRYGHWHVKQSARVLNQKLYLKIVCVRPVRDFSPAKWFGKAPRRDKCSMNLDKGLPLCGHSPITYCYERPDHGHKVISALWQAFARCRNHTTFDARILDFGIANDCKRCYTDYLVDMIKEGDLLSVRVTRWTCLGDGMSPIDPYWTSLVSREVRSRPNRPTQPQQEGIRSRGEARRVYQVAEDADAALGDGV